MKKIISSLSLVAFISLAAASQGIYFRAGTGYGLPIATSSIGESHTEINVSNGNMTTTTTSVKGIKASYGSGLSFNFGLGYKINQILIIDLNLQYLSGKEYETGNSYTYESPGYTYVDYDLTRSSAKGFLFNPSVIFNSGLGTAAPYARLGFILGSPAVTSTMESYYNGDGVDSTVVNYEYVKGFAFGFQGAVGVNWKVLEKLDIFTEINFAGLTYYPGERNMTQNLQGYGSNKVDQIIDNLPNLSISQKTTAYEREYDPTKVNSDSSQPTIATELAFPLSSFSFQVGIRIALWN